jgi:predicted anti-sigma-YlaC factor YlaD
MRSARCQRSRLWVSARLDASLTELEAVLLDRHLRSCAACRHFAADTARHTELLRSTEIAEAPAPLEVAWAVPARRPPSRRALTVAVGLSAVAASLALTVGGQAPSFGGSPSFVAAAPTQQNDSLGVPRSPVPKPRGQNGIMRGEPGSLS